MPLQGIGKQSINYLKWHRVYKNGFKKYYFELKRIRNEFKIK